MKNFKKWMVVPYEEKIESSEENDMKSLKDILSNKNLNDSQKYNHFNTLFKNLNNKKSTISEKKETTLPDELPEKLPEELIHQSPYEINSEYNTPDSNRSMPKINDKDSETNERMDEVKNQLDILNVTRNRPISKGTRSNHQKKKLEKEKKELEKTISKLKRDGNKRKNTNNTPSSFEKQKKSKNDDLINVKYNLVRNLVKEKKDDINDLWEFSDKGNSTINKMILE